MYSLAQIIYNVSEIGVQNTLAGPHTLVFFDHDTGKMVEVPSDPNLKHVLTRFDGKYYDFLGNIVRMRDVRSQKSGENIEEYIEDGFEILEYITGPVNNEGSLDHYGCRFLCKYQDELFFCVPQLFYKHDYLQFHWWQSSNNFYMSAAFKGPFYATSLEFGVFLSMSSDKFLSIAARYNVDLTVIGAYCKAAFPDPAENNAIFAPWILELHHGYKIIIGAVDSIKEVEGVIMRDQDADTVPEDPLNHHIVKKFETLPAFSDDGKKFTAVVDDDGKKREVYITKDLLQKYLPQFEDKKKKHWESGAYMVPVPLPLFLVNP